MARKALLIVALATVFSVQVNAQVAGRWTKRSSAGFVGSMGLASAVYDGKIYVFGGADWSKAGPMNRVQIYDPATDAWSTPNVSGYFPPREGLGGLTIGDKIYVVGRDSLRVFDPVNMSWSTPAATGIQAPTGWIPPAVVDGRIYAFESKYQGPQVEVYDTGTKVWSVPRIRGDTPPANIYAVTAPTVGVGGKSIYVLGSTFDEKPGVWLYGISNPGDSDVWQRTNPTGSFAVRTYFSVAELNGKLYTMGGFGQTGTAGGDVNTFEAFDLRTGRWSVPQTDGALTARNQLTSAIAKNVIYAIGGLDVNGQHNTVEAFEEYPLGVASRAAATPIQLYPNPCNKSITVSGLQMEPATVEIYDALGRKCIVTRGNENAKSIEVRELPRGAYIVRIVSPLLEDTEVLVKN